MTMVMLRYQSWHYITPCLLRDECVIEWDTLKACISANFRNLSLL